MKKICFVTGSRAEYGLLKRLIFLTKKEKNLRLQLIVSCMHLSSKFGKTINEIQKDGFKINYKANLGIKTSKIEDICKYVGKGVEQLSRAYKKLKPDYIILLGDRFETFSAATAALIHNIPIIHIHGGELTESLIDDAFRHSITKMSSYHFVANKIYKKRVVQLGEDPRKIFNVGGLGVDNIKNTTLLSKKEIENELNIKFLEKNLMVTFHPETLAVRKTQKDIKTILKELNKLQDTCIIFTSSNADTNGDYINFQIKKFVKNKRNSYFFYSLGNKNYYSCLQYVDAVIGNSSSGLAEVPSFNKFTLNLGNRQDGRLKAESVIDSEINGKKIKKKLNIIFKKNSKAKLKKVINPYGYGDASKKIFKIINKLKNKKDTNKKSFFDIKF